jgi:hypothetical protein
MSEHFAPWSKVVDALVALRQIRAFYCLASEFSVILLYNVLVRGRVYPTALFPDFVK